MLVQLSSFKTVKSSIKIPTTKRRRKRNESDLCDFPADASFVTTASRRGQQKWKQHSAEFTESQPILLISSDHQISTIGRSKDLSYDEFSSLRYSSRPGNVSSFAPASSGKNSDELPRIPAILDAKNEQVYALQHGNSRLCCWNALKANGPDEKHAVRVDLAKPAVSMALLPMHKGVVYGSCTDGTIFIARLERANDDTEELSVEYLPNKLKDTSHHAGTFAELPQGYAQGAGRKRKMSDADGHTSVSVYQVFHDKKSLHLVRHEVQFERFASGGKMIVDGTLNQQMVQIKLVSESDQFLESAKLLVSTSGSGSKTAVTYRVKKSKSDTSPEFCSALLSLASGDLTHSGVTLPRGTKQCGMISETLLVVTAEQHMYLYDLETGSILQTVSLPKVLLDVDAGWLLCTDAKFGTLAILYQNSGVLHCDFSSVMLDDSQETLANTKLSLASRLASSAIDMHAHAEGGTTIVVNNVLDLHSPSSPPPKKKNMEATIQEVLSSLDNARLKICSSTEEQVEDFVFMDTYEGSVATLLAALENAKSNTDGNEGQHNPQDDSSSNGHGRLNGSSHVAKILQMNGLTSIQSSSLAHARAITPAILPQAFIDGATQIVLKMLQAGTVEDRTVARRIALTRLDARVILSRLLHTGKLSARHHFDGTESIQSSEGEHQLTTVLRSLKLSNKRGRRWFTPVDMMITMLQKCPDVSERQMVVMLSHTMRRALPEDIAEMLIEERKYSLHSQHSSLARKFFALRSNLMKSSDRSATDPVESPELDNLSRRLILAGTSYLLYRIVSYSQCNEAMLRVAFLDLVEKDEAIILARLLSNILASTRAKDVISKAPPSVNAVRSICQWVAALCDSFHEELSTVRGDDGQTYLTSLLRAVNLTTKHSQEIISLKEDVRRVEADIQAKLEAQNTPAAARKLPNQEDLPGYSVETLSF
jgi:hypothetical protein